MSIAENEQPIRNLEVLCAFNKKTLVGRNQKRYIYPKERIRKKFKSVHSEHSNVIASPELGSFEMIELVKSELILSFLFGQQFRGYRGDKMSSYSSNHFK